MDRSKYVSEVYKGKHEPHNYKVWRVLGPGGPEETVYVVGKQAAKAAVNGCWDYEVTNMDTGKELKVL